MARFLRGKKLDSRTWRVSYSFASSFPHLCSFIFLAVVNNLKVCSLTLFQLFTLLKELPAGRGITKEELKLASGKIVFDPGHAKAYFNNLKIASENIRAAFEKQAVNAAVFIDFNEDF